MSANSAKHVIDVTISPHPSSHWLVGGGGGIDKPSLHSERCTSSKSDKNWLLLDPAR